MILNKELGVIEQAKLIHETYNREFSNLTSIDRTELTLAVLAGLIGATTDMFFVTSVNSLSKTNIIGFKPESGINHLRDSGLINRFVNDLLAKFHKSPFAQWLEWKCKVPFDKTVRTGILGLTPENHRLLTPGHDPILGLYYGTKDIMRGEFTVCDNNADMYKLINTHGQQVNLILAFLKEIGHLLSDVGTKTSVPFPGLWLLCKQKGVSPVNDLTWTMLANGLYRKGFTLDYLLTLSVPMIFANLVLLAGELVYGLALRMRGEFSPLDDKKIFYHRTKIMRTIAYAIMVTSNIAKVAATNGNVLAVNVALYPKFLAGSFDLLRNYYRLEDKRHAYVMDKLNQRYNNSQDRFNDLLNYGRS